MTVEFAWFSFVTKYPNENFLAPLFFLHESFYMKMKLKIALINPNIFGDPNVPGSYRKARVPSVNLGLGALAAYIESKSDHQVDIIDARFEGLDPNDAFEKICALKPHIVGVSLCSHESTTWTIPFLKLVKKMTSLIHITVGNHFASLFPQKALDQIKDIDSVVIGEGEETFFDLVNHLENKTNWSNIAGIAYRNKESDEVIVNRGRTFIQDINTLPWPKRGLLDKEGENCEIVLEGSRGCAFNCSFCTIGPFFGLQQGIALRQKSAKIIYEELSHLCKLYPKLQRIRFVDPEFLVGGRAGAIRVEQLAKLLIDDLPDLKICIEGRASSIIRHAKTLKLLKTAGLARINIGIESGSQKILDKMNKCTKVEDNIEATRILRELGIDYSYGFMMITPWCTEEDIEKNAALLENIGKIEMHKFFHEMTLIPGTKAYEEMKKRKQIIWKGDLHYYTYKTESNRIERYRKLAATLERQHNNFFKNMSFAYESIRAFMLYGEEALAKSVEKKADRLFAEIFRFCWNAVVDDLKEEDFLEFAKKCYTLFLDQIVSIIQILDPFTPLPIPPYHLPKHATRYQA